MRSLMAALRTLVLPFGTITGRRILLDGITGRIVIYDNNGNERLVLDSAEADTSEAVFSTGLAGEITAGGVGVIPPAAVTDRAEMFVISPEMDAGSGEAGILLCAGSDDGANDALVQIVATGTDSRIDATLPARMVVQEIVAGTFVDERQDPTEKNWVTPALTAGWTNGAAGFNSLRYRHNALGMIDLSGIFQNTSGGNKAVGSNVFTLPAGYRPAGQARITSSFAAGGGSAATCIAVDIATTGAVTVQHTAVPNSSFVAVAGSFPLA